MFKYSNLEVWFVCSVDTDLNLCVEKEVFVISFSETIQWKIGSCYCLLFVSILLCVCVWLQMTTKSSRKQLLILMSTILWRHLVVTPLHKAIFLLMFSVTIMVSFTFNIFRKNKIASERNNQAMNEKLILRVMAMTTVKAKVQKQKRNELLL